MSADNFIILIMGTIPGSILVIHFEIMFVTKALHMNNKYVSIDMNINQVYQHYLKPDF